MRQIKFRFWDSETDRYDGQMPRMRYWPSSPEEISLDAWIKGGAPCMQFTGLHDKNGKEIYEGDVVLATMVDAKTYRGVVEWQDDSADFDISHPELGHQVAFGLDESCYEVIGNIYENPELLK